MTNKTPPSAESIPTEQYRDDPPGEVMVEWISEDVTELWVWPNGLQQRSDGFGRSPSETYASYRRQPDGAARLYWSRATGSVREAVPLGSLFKDPAPKNAGRWRDEFGNIVDFGANTYTPLGQPSEPLDPTFANTDMGKFGWVRIPDEESEEKNATVESCESCKFFCSSFDGSGECRRHPPVLLTTRDEYGWDIHSHWPDVQEGNWCGEYVARTSARNSDD